MAIQQPPMEDDQAKGQWQFEVTRQNNNLEQRINALLRAIEEATDLNDLKQRTRRL